MTFQELFEQHKGMRRLIVSVMIVWISAAVGVGLWRLTELTATSNVFLLAILAMLNVPVAVYFHQRATEDRAEGPRSD